MRNEPIIRRARLYVCAFCHKSGTMIKVGNIYYHDKCPKKVIPFKRPMTRALDIVRDNIFTKREGG